MGRLVIAGYHQDGLRSVNMQVWNWKGLEVTNAHEREGRGLRPGHPGGSGGRRRGQTRSVPRSTRTDSRWEDLGVALDMTKERPAGFMKALVIFE